MNWQVYYSDGMTISSEDMTPFSIDKPWRMGVQTIIQEDAEKGWIALPPYDYYMWDDRGDSAKWFPGDRDGLMQYMMQSGSKCILLGEWIDTIAYREILNRANEDRTFASKTGYAPWERKP